MAGSTEALKERLGRLGAEQLQKLLGELMQNERFQQAFATAFGRAMSARHQFNKNMTFLLATLQVPSRKDIERLNDKIEALGGKVAALDRRLEALSSAPARTPRAARPKPRSKSKSKSSAKKRPSKPAATTDAPAPAAGGPSPTGD